VTPEARPEAEPRHLHFLGLGPAGFHRLHACDWGQADNERIVVCAHGYSGNARDFDYLARSLAETHRVVCPDIAGRGESGWLTTALEYSFPQFLSDLNALLARLGPREVDWVGTSMGGILGMLLAAQPNTPIRRLVMNDVGAFLPMPALQHIGQNLVAPATFASLAKVEAHLRRTRREWGELDDAQWREMARHHSRETEDGFRLHYDPTIARVMQPMPFTPGLFFWDAWQSVRCPVLLLRGEHSAVFPRLVADAMRTRNPDARIVEIENCGHAPSLMVDGQAALVAEFLATPVARPASQLNWRHERQDSPAAVAGAAH
jgi:pimeloyl-ACP methyl ester carboxylesterase